MVKNWLCAAAQTTLFEPANDSVRGAPFMHPKPAPENQVTGWSLALVPSDHIMPVVKLVSSTSIGVAVPTINSCAGSASGWPEVFSNRTLAFTRKLELKVKSFTSRNPSAKDFSARMPPAIGVKVKMPSPASLASPPTASIGSGARVFNDATESLTVLVFFQRCEIVCG